MFCKYGPLLQSSLDDQAHSSASNFQGTSADVVMFLINLTHTARDCNKELGQIKIFTRFSSCNKAGRVTYVIQRIPSSGE